MPCANLGNETTLYAVPQVLVRGRWETKPGHELAAAVNQSNWSGLPRFSAHKRSR